MKNNPNIIPCLIFFIVISLFYSCKKETHLIIKEYYSSGELMSETPIQIKDSLKDGTYKQYYKNGNLKTIAYFKGNVQSDSTLNYFEKGGLSFKEVYKGDTIFSSYYYKNGNLSILSNLLKGNPPKEIGWTKIFNIDEIFIDSLNFIYIQNERKLNQRINYDKHGTIVPDSSNFYRMKLSKIKNTNIYRLHVKYFPFFKGATVMMIISKDINNDFSNLSKLKLDTLFLDNNTLTSNILERPYQNLKGFFYEYDAKIKHAVGKDSTRWTISERKTYFDTTVKVTDTIEPIK